MDQETVNNGKSETPLLLGVSIISEMHQYFEARGDDDREHIVNLSLVIKGISGYLKSAKMTKKERDMILSELEEFGKKLWIDSCVEQNEYGEPEKEIREDSEYIFDHIFKHHDYPD